MTIMRPASRFSGTPPLEWDTCSPEELRRLASLLGAQDEAPWQDFAACRGVDGEMFFPEKGGTTTDARRICQGCEVRTECLDFALARHEQNGIWGGLSPRERRKLTAPSAMTTQDDEALRLHGLGWTTAAIALAIGFTERTVLRILNRAEKRGATREGLEECA
jgi:WhiB family transcriptional regulator, redox-sensing transcriptional regulator